MGRHDEVSNSKSKTHRCRYSLGNLRYAAHGRIPIVFQTLEEVLLAVLAMTGPSSVIAGQAKQSAPTNMCDLILENLYLGFRTSIAPAGP